jgi:4'-phosphopantetheinyl transferase
MGSVVVGYGEVPAHGLLLAMAARFHSVPVERIVLGHDCPRCGGDDHGRPVLLPTSSLRAPAHVSLARAGSMSVAAVTVAGPVGIDVEPPGAAEFEGYADVALHPDERAGNDDPTRAWVRKEALLKAYGLGLAIDPREIRIDARGLAAWDSAHPAPTDVWVRDIDVPGHIAALAVLAADGAEGVAVEVIRW